MVSADPKQSEALLPSLQEDRNSPAKTLEKEWAQAGPQLNQSKLCTTSKVPGTSAPAVIYSRDSFMSLRLTQDTNR